MRNLTKSLLLLVVIMIPATLIAQSGTLKVKATGKTPGIKDFARAYCSPLDDTSFEREALAAFSKGSFKRNKKECITDSKNGYLKYSSLQDGVTETLEMCYWRCNNKNEILVAVNRISDAMGFDECFLSFYRYNAKTKTMKLIKTPFDRMPQPIDMIDSGNASKMVIDEVTRAKNEDSNKFQPCYQLPRTGKNITFRMADPKAVQKDMQRTGVMHWNGSGFNIVQ